MWKDDKQETEPVVWCQCQHNEEEQQKTCEVVCVCPRCGKPIKRRQEEIP